jgi:glyoxylase-like metal-dependent hydrolase (beta-lactamase superfamily II)
MPGPTGQLTFDTSNPPSHGVAEALAEGLVRLTAPNAGPYTFSGTNTFILGDSELAIVDPGPNSDAHLDAILATVAGRPVRGILLTHTHIDHSALVPRLARYTGAPVWCGGPHRLSRGLRPFEINLLAGASDWSIQPDRVFYDGERVFVGDVKLEIITTPGHAANHLAFGIVGTPYLLTGDHVMGWNSTLVAVPDGSMRAYLASLKKVIASPYTAYVPAHGGIIADGPNFARALLAHREKRNRQIIDAVTLGDRSIAALRRRLYPRLSGPVARAARMTLQAHVEYLAEEGLIRDGLSGLRPV